MKRFAWLAIVIAGSTASADVSLKLDHEPVSRHLTMRPRHRPKVSPEPVATASSAPEPKPVLAAPEPPPPQAYDEPAQIRDLQQRVSARFNLGYVVDGTQLNKNNTDMTLDQQFAKIRAYGFGEGYLSTHGVGFESLSSYFAGRFILANQIETQNANIPGGDADGNHKTPPPIATWFERSNFEPRSGWAEAKDFLGSPELRIRGGEQYIYGPWVLHMYGANVAWEGKLIHANVYGGSQVPDYTVDPSLPEARAGIYGGGVRVDLRDLRSSPLPITIGIQSVNLTGGENTESSHHNQLELEWRPRKDIALIGQARTLASKFVDEHVQLRARYHDVTNFVLDVTHVASTDWLWDPTVLDPDPVAAKRYLDLGPVLPQLTGSLRAGTLIAENVDVYARGAFAADLASDNSRETYSASYLEGGGAVEVRVRRTVAIGASALTRQTERDDQVSAEIIDIPNQPDAIPVNASSQMGERGFTELGVTARMSLGARKFSLLLEVYGRRTRYALDYCALTEGASDCRSALDTGIQSLAYRGGGRAQIDAWIGQRLRLFASYDLSSSLDFEPNITGYKSLRLMMEGIY
jgi:hypothetical protein